MLDDSLPKLYSPQIGERGMTPLHYAAYCGDAAALAASLDEGMAFALSSTQLIRN